MWNCSAFRRRAGPSELSGSAAASSGRGLQLKTALGGQRGEASFVVLVAECALVRPSELRLRKPASALAFCWIVALRIGHQAFPARQSAGLLAEEKRM